MDKSSLALIICAIASKPEFPKSECNELKVNQYSPAKWLQQKTFTEQT